ncbi:oxidoreductase [Aureococcus anophagefferens]|nr:oxidoreductase [Aureococcus anophagefferens]
MASRPCRGRPPSRVPWRCASTARGSSTAARSRSSSGRRAAAASPADRTAFVSQEREALVACLRRHGAVVLRGWGPTSTSRDPGDVAGLCPDAHGGMACSAGVRLTVVDGGATHAVVTANEAPPEDTIPFHHEMAQCSTPPKYICFFCEREPATGGATPLVISRHVTAYLRATFPDLYARLKARASATRA